MTTADFEILADLEALTDDELRVAITKATVLLDDRDKQRKKEALERARAIMTEAGLPFPVEHKKPGRKSKAS